MLPANPDDAQSFAAVIAGLVSGEVRTAPLFRSCGRMMRCSRMILSGAILARTGDRYRQHHAEQTSEC
jgi:hypothetical protein